MKIHSSYLNDKDNWELFKSIDNNKFWYKIKCREDLSKEFNIEFKNKLKIKNKKNFLRYVVVNCVLSENFIIKYENDISWFHVALKQKLSEEFIEKYESKLRWVLISHHQKLSEEFIIKYKDKIFWERLDMYQDLSSGFISNFQNLINYKYENISL
jgi:hypothetical protein